MDYLGIRLNPAGPQPGLNNDREASFRENLRLLSLLLNGDHYAAADHLQRGAVRPDDFARFVEKHWLLLPVFSLLRNSPVRGLLQRQWLDQLKRSTLRQWATQEGLVHELMRLSALLKAGGHEFILLKGPYVATRFFGGVDRRAFSDLDILIRKENLTAVERLLCASGYVPKSSTLLSRALTTYFTHSFDFVNPRASLDLHWQFSAQYSHRLDYEAIWQQKRAFTFRSHDFLVLSDEHEVVFSLITIFKDFELGIARLRAFVDLYFILSEIGDQLDWEAFFEHRKREKVLRISLSILDLFFQLFDCTERFSTLATGVARARKRLKVVFVKHPQALMEAVPGAARNKLWASGLYECSRFTLLLWWVVGLPFRIAVHHPEKYARMKRRIQRLRSCVCPKGPVKPDDPPQLSRPGQ